MVELINAWLLEQGIGQQYIALISALVGTLLMLVICACSLYITKHQVLVIIHKWVISSKNQWDDMLLEARVFSNVAWLIPIILLLFLTPILLDTSRPYTHGLIMLAKVALSFQVARSLSSLLNVINSGYQQKAKEKYLPLNATIQVIKLVIYLVATILAISFVLGRSPVYLLSGLGALTAVLLLVFQDTIKGLVASIQISANRMVAPGDWIEIPKYGADGDVLEIGLNTVKVRNFDNTVTTVPTYALISGSFKNWRDMFQSGGRRIKRTITIDVSSIGFCNEETLAELEKINLINAYLSEKKQLIAESVQQQNLTSASDVNARQLTNIGTFRAYIEAYLQQHDNVHHEMTCMVRQLKATDTGLPLELYFFSNDQRWVNYEAIQADIFDHLYAMLPVFKLRAFQHPTGYDWQRSQS